jgi:glyoxylase-like metal-dependent hydrolase (beta-lactamase superfamily II)
MGKPAAVNLAGPVWRIPTAPASLINTFAFVEDDGSVTLVDCGVRWGTLRRIRAGLAEMGRHPRDVTRIVLTHAHVDHAGGARSVMRASRAPGVTVHEDDEDFVRTGQPPPRDPHHAPSWFAAVDRRTGGFPQVIVAETVRDGDVLPVAGGVEVVHTPGHTPGHVSLRHPDSGVLVTGDAIWNMRSRMTWPWLATCTDVALTQETADVLGELEYTTAAFTHGPEIRSGAREAVRGFLRTATREPSG